MENDGAATPEATVDAGRELRRSTRRRLIGILGGSALFATMLVLPPPEGACFGRHFVDNVRFSFSATPLDVIAESRERFRKAFSDGKLTGSN